MTSSKDCPDCKVKLAELAELEWVDSEQGPACPDCGAIKQWNPSHAPDCKLAMILRLAKAADEPID